jgi:hypothetical protein
MGALVEAIFNSKDGDQLTARDLGRRHFDLDQ